MSVGQTRIGRDSGEEGGQMIRPCRLGSERGWQAGREAGSPGERRRLHVEANVPFLPQEEGCRGGEEDVGHARERDREGEHPFNKTPNNSTVGEFCTFK